MPGAQPDGDPAPADGSLPASVLEGAGERAFGLYVHVPFCSVRCGYCDFNTYTAAELGGGASQDEYAGTAAGELELAARVLAGTGLPGRPMDTVFFGGGTPTLIPADDLAEILGRAVGLWGLAPGAEVTTEANPDSVTPESLRRLAAAGFTRVSFGMQSAVPHVLATLERTHDPERVPGVVAAAKDAGLAVSLDLIYGTPGESTDDWRRSVDAALELEPDHVSAYSLIVEPGTKMGRSVRRGELAMPDEDDLAEKYELADGLLAAAGYGWYEVSNWARTDADACRHNLAYWTGQDWWGVGPGAHSHVGGVRWWNVKHPRAYAARLAEGASPAAAREVLPGPTRLLERILLETRLKDGIELALLSVDGRRAVAGLIADGLVDPRSALGGRLRLTDRGRLMADAVVRAVVD